MSTNKYMLKIGEINTNEFVELFGSDEQIKKYKTSKKLYTNTKKSLLKKASLKCEIIDLGRGKYDIVNIYKSELTYSHLSLLNNEIYSIMCPVIIDNIIKSKNNEEVVLNLSLINYYGFMNLIHKNNYNIIRYNQTKISKDYDLNKYNVYNFFEVANEKLRYFLEKSLKLLEGCGLIKWQSIRFVKVRNIEIISSHKKVKTKVTNKHRRATEEEYRFIEDTITYICNKYNIENINKFIYSNYNSKIKKEFYEKLIEKNIVYFYKGYEVYYTDIKDSLKFMELFENYNRDLYIKNFNSKISKNIKDSLFNRDENYAETDYIFLSKHTLDYECNDLDYLGFVVNNTGDYHCYESEILECE